MKKWNKYDTQFILRALAISGIAIMIWTFFYSAQINEDYLQISLSEKEAKQKAQQYFGSRGWDISGYTYSCKYNWGIHKYYNYTEETSTEKNIVELQRLNELTGENRWLMRWYNPPQTDEIQIGYTKEGDLTFFNHIIAETVAGDSLPGDIAYDIAIMFLQNMTTTKWEESDWKMQINRLEQKPNRVDHYFQWENNKYKFGNSTARMSIWVRGNEVGRFNRWLERGFDDNQNLLSLIFKSNFLDSFNQFIKEIIMLVAFLIALFYFKIPTNWKIATKFGIFIFIIHLIKHFSEIPTRMFRFDSSDTLIASVFNYLSWGLLEGLFEWFLAIVMVAGCEKLYRNTFPQGLSFENIFNPTAFSNKLYFNNYSAGIVFAFCTLAFTGIYYSLMNYMGYYIPYPYLDLNSLLTYNPLLYIISSGIELSFTTIIPYIFLVLLLFLLTKSKLVSVVISSLLLSIQGTWDTEPLVLGIIFILIIGLASGYIFFRFGILSLFVSAFSVFIFTEIFLYFNTGQIYYITTGIILILLLLSPLIYCLLHYVKHQWVADSDKLLNAAISLPELDVSDPDVPRLEPIHKSHKNWGLLLFVIGMICLLIPNNDALGKYFTFNISKSEALDQSKQIIEKNFNERIDDYDTGTTIRHNNHLNWWGDSKGPLQIRTKTFSNRLAYVLDKLGRDGLAELYEKYDISNLSWQFKYFKHSQKENYNIALGAQNNKLTKYWNELSDSLALPSLKTDEAKAMIQKKLSSLHPEIANLSISETQETNQNVRIDQYFEFTQDLILQNQTKIEQRIMTGIAGNKFTEYNTYFKVPESWEREYGEFNILNLFNNWSPWIILISSLIFGMYMLIQNTYIKPVNISWHMISIVIVGLAVVFITYFLNVIPHNLKGFYWSTIPWDSYVLENIGDLLADFSQICVTAMIPLCCMYLSNVQIKNLFSQKSQKMYSKDAFISTIATLGAMLLYRPVKYMMYSYFPNYFDITINRFNTDISFFTYYFPGYGLFLSIIIETFFLFTTSIFLYHKYMEYLSSDKTIKKNIIILLFGLFYIFYNAFANSPIAMLPHFLSKISGLILLLLMIKYFWKGNPLSHLFGILIYVHLDRIFNFISIADSSLKPQGWIILIILLVVFIYSVGFENIRRRDSSKTA